MKHADQNNVLSSIETAPMQAWRPDQYIDTLVIEPCVLVRVGIDWLLNKSRYRVVARVDLIEHHDLAVAPTRPPALIILSIPSESASFVEAVRHLKSRYAGARLACLCRNQEPEHVASLLHAGVDGFLMAHSNALVFTKSLDIVMSGEMILPIQFLNFARTSLEAGDEIAIPSCSVAQSTPRTLPLPEKSLSDRECEILELLVHGDTNKLIGMKLGISDASVKVHIKGILRKIQLQNRTQAAIWALDNLVADMPSR